MSRIMPKNLHRSMFIKFREVLTYRCEWNDRKLVIADKLDPSTQTCYECGAVMDRAENAVQNLINYIQHEVEESE